MGWEVLLLAAQATRQDLVHPASGWGDTRNPTTANLCVYCHCLKGRFLSLSSDGMLAMPSSQTGLSKKKAMGSCGPP